MAGNTPQHDAWVTDSFGVDPTHYAVNPQGSVPQRANGPDAAPGAPPADDQAAYAAALKAAEADLKTLKGDVIKDDAARIKKDLIDAARAAAAAKDYAGALKLLGQVAKACADARDITARHTAYLQALADAEKALAGLTEPAIVPERDKIKTELIDAARAKIAPPARDYDGAAQLLGQVAARCQAAKGIVGQQAAYETALKAVEDKLAKAAADVSAPEIAKIKAECIDPAKLLVAPDKRDYPSAMALLAQATKRLDLADLHKRRYEAGLKVAEGNYNNLATRAANAALAWPGWGATPIPGVTPAIAEIKTKFLDPGKARAATGDYAGAMTALDAMMDPMNAAFGTLNAFYGFASARALAGMTYDATYASASLPALKTALEAIKADTLDKGVNFAKAGDNEKATAAVQAAGPRMLPLVDVVGKRNAASTAVNALTAAPLATDKARMQKDRLDAADALIVAGNVAGAGDLLGKAAGEATQIAAYGAALAAAQAELDKLTQPAIAADAARIKTDYMDAAKTRAIAWDYAGAAALLKKVPAEAVNAGKLATTQDQAEKANQGAQTKVAAAPAGGVTAVTKLLKDLEAHPNAAGIAKELDAIRADIAAADAAVKAKKPDDARAALDKAGKELVDARVLAERNGQGDAELQAAKTRVAGLPAAAGPDKTTIDTTMLQPAIAKFNAGDRAAGLKLLSNIEPACAAADVTAAQALQYTTALTAAEAAWNALTDPFIAADKAQIKTTLIDAAKTAAAARHFDQALPLLAKVADACATATSIAKTNALYQPAFATMQDNYNKTLNNIAYGKANKIPARPDYDARAKEVLTQYINPAKARAAARGLGPPALTAMQDALKLATDGGAKANAIINDTYFYVDSDRESKAAVAAVAALKKHPAHAAVTREITALDKSLADAASLLAAGQTGSAHQTYQAIEAQTTEATALANDGAAYNTALTAAQIRLSACKAAVATLAPTPPVIAALRAAEAETLTAAQSRAATHDFKDAAGLLAQVNPRCTSVEALVAQQKKFGEALVPAEAALAKLNQPAVAEEVQRIRAERVEPAKARAAAADYPAALDLLAKATAEAANAARVAAGNQEAQTARTGAQPALDGGDLPAAIAAVQKLLDALLALPQAATIKDMTDRVAAVIAAAKKTPPPKDAKAKLTEAADLCVQARLAADNEGNYASTLATAEAALAALTSPIVATDKAKIQKDRIDAAKLLAAPKTRDFTKAMALLDTAMTECAAARDIVAKDAAFQTALTAAQAALDGLHAITPAKDPAIGDDAIALQHDSIDAAKALVAAPKRDYDGALKLLSPVAAACKSLAMKKTMEANTPPTKADIDAIMAQPGGTAQLDKMVASLPDATPPAVLQKAIESRFGVQSFKNLDKTGAATGPGVSGAKSLKKIYALMSKVPQQNVQNNASLKQIELYGGEAKEKENRDRGSYYSGGDKKIVLSCGRAEDHSPQPLARAPLALPNVEPDCEMVPDSEVPVPEYFDWTTLHEVAHAIDDKQHFMDHRAGDSAFGGWQAHGSDVAPVAKAIAQACKIAGQAGEAYLAAYLVKANSPKPAAPAGRADWADAVKQAEAWCDAIRVDKQLWESGSGASGHVADGRVYHEAYGGTWVSYEIAARTKGITGYQFRAPGEWVSELYAAYHTKKLKPSHPAVTWLATL